MATRIRKHARAHLYIEEHMEKRGLSFEDVGNRLGVSRTTVWRWANEQWRLNPPKIEAVADAIGLESPGDLYRPPRRPSLDAYLADAPDDVFEATMDVARRLHRRAS